MASGSPSRLDARLGTWTLVATGLGLFMIFLDAMIVNVAIPDIQQQLVKLGTIPADSPSPEEQQRFIDSEIVRWAKVVHQAGIAGSE